VLARPDVLVLDEDPLSRQISGHQLHETFDDFPRKPGRLFQLESIL
jgi:hypothetical protein